MVKHIVSGTRAWVEQQALAPLRAWRRRRTIARLLLQEARNTGQLAVAYPGDTVHFPNDLYETLWGETHELHLVTRRGEHLRAPLVWIGGFSDLPDEPLGVGFAEAAADLLNRGKLVYLDRMLYPRETVQWRAVRKWGRG